MILTGCKMKINVINLTHFSCTHITGEQLRGLHFYVALSTSSINFGTLTLQWWQNEKEHDRVRDSIAVLSTPYHPNTFYPFPGLSQENYRITLLKSLSKHRQIPYQPWPQLWQDDLRCTATRSVCCLSEQSPSSNLHICPGCINDPSLFDFYLNGLFRRLVTASILTIQYL